MEGIPSGDLQAKYQKLASEYSKIRSHVHVLKKGIYDEQAKTSDLKELLKEKEKNQRKGELEIDSLNFRNQQLTKRIAVLQDELDSVQSQKNSKKSKHKSDEQRPSQLQGEVANNLLLQEELQKKIIENAELVSKMADKDFQLSQLNTRLEDAERHLTDVETKFKCETLKLRSQNQDLLMNLESVSNNRDKNSSSNQNVNFRHNQLSSLNGDFLSEAGSLMGSEDALSAEESHVNEQLSKNTQQLAKLEQDNQNLRIEIDLIKMENNRFKSGAQPVAKSQDTKKSNSENKEDAAASEQAYLKMDGVITEILGTMNCPFVLSDEILKREEDLKTYFREKLTSLIADKQKYESMTKYYVDEADALYSQLECLQKEKQDLDQSSLITQATISRLEDELHSISTNYEQQLSILTEHVGNLNDKLTQQFEEIQHLKLQLGKKR